MQILTKEVRDGLHDGRIVWVCHYNRPNLDKKALRCIPPTRCVIQPVSYTDKAVYYSKSYFAPLSSVTSIPTARVISPVDNTGEFSRPGNPLFVFDNETECKVEWNKQIDIHIETVDEKIISSAIHWQNEKDELEFKKIKIGDCK